MVWAEAWGVALLMAQLWVLASVVAWQLPMLLQWGCGVAVRWRSRSQWQWALASVYLLPPQQRCRLVPNHRRCLEGPRSPH